MNKFKARVNNNSQGEEISEENFARETEMTSPYVQVNASKEKSYFAVCPECNNPIQIVGLFSSNKNAAVYGKHANKTLARVATYDEKAKIACKYFTGRKCTEPFKKIDKGDVENILYQTMKNEFDKVVYFWNVLTGIKLNRKVAEEYLREWRENKVWKMDFCTSSSLAISLYYPNHEHNLIHQYIRIGSDLYNFLLSEYSNKIEFVDVGLKKYKKLEPKADWVDLQFNLLLHGYVRRSTTTGCFESVKLEVLEDRKSVKLLDIKIDSDYWQNVLAMSNFNRDDKLLAIAQKCL